MTPRNKLSELIALAGEGSSARRRELLRELTDVFFASTAIGVREMALFDAVLSRLASEMEAEVRAELSQRFADAREPPPRLVRAFARDDIAVAEPVLRRSTALGDSDLVDVAQTASQAHLRAISARADVGETVSEVIVTRGDDETVGVLVRNDGARLSRGAAEAVVDRAAASPDLHEAVVERRDLPPDLLNEMYFMVEARLRSRILERNAALDPQTLAAALEAGRNRVAARDGALPSDYTAAQGAMRALIARGGLTSQVLVSLLRSGERTKFLLALAESTKVDFSTASRIVERRDLDALAILCKAAGFDRALFLTFAILIVDSESAMGRAQEYGRLYSELPLETAQRTLRFWRARREGGDAIAA